MSLRDYQIAVVDALRRELATGARRVLLVLPTGGGKTRTLGDVVRRSVDRGHRALWLAHRGELVDQAAAALAATGLRVGALSASAATDADPGAPVQVATIQTLLARGLRPEAHVIVADEAHHYVAATWRPLLEAYPHAWILGCTATPERGDGRGLGELYERLVVGGTVRALTAGGYLCPAEVVRPPRKLRAGEIAQRPIDAYLAHAPGRRAVVFSRSVHHAREHAAQFAEAGYRAAVVTGETPWEERRRALDDLRAGTLHALVNVYVATEGFDVPEIECVILARGFGSAGGYLQCVGRALRPADGKDRAIVVDLVGTSYEHGLPDDDRQYSLDGRGIQRAGERADQAYCRVCGAPRNAGEPCAECGTEPAVVEERVVGAKLEKFAAKRAETVDQRVATLRRWYAVADERGYRDGWVINKFKATYGSWPTAAMRSAARAA